MSQTRIEYGEARIVDGIERSDEDRRTGLRDSDRIHYSSAFRRLGGITQVVSPQDGYLFHDRSMHSWKVAQVGSRIAARFPTKVDPDVVWAAGLAHDLGHPPFGHAGEKELQLVLGGKIDFHGRSTTNTPLLRDTFEGNAQSFRIATRLSARKLGENAGLNLSWRCYGALLKYPWIYGENDKKKSRKWGAYDSESALLEITKERCETLGLWGTERSVEAAMMDWADDITYAVHDSEDFFRANLLPLDALKNNDATWTEFVEYAYANIQKDWPFVTGKITQSDFQTLVANNIWAKLPGTPYEGDFDSRYSLHYFASELITYLSAELDINSDKDFVISEESWIVAATLKLMTRYYVIEEPNLAAEQIGQRRVIRELFFLLYETALKTFTGGSKSSTRTLAPRLVNYCNLALDHSDGNVSGSTQSKIARATTDYICSLTDRQAELQWRRLVGLSGQSTSANWASI